MKTRTSIMLLVASTALVLLLAINVGYRFVLDDLYRTIDDELGRQLSGLAESFATALDPDAVSGAVGDSGTFSPDDYLLLWDATREYAFANRLVSVTILDSLWRDPFADDDSLSRMVYTLLDQEGTWALQAGLSWVSETYRWEDNYYRSAAAPILDSSGIVTVGVVRLEADAQYFAALDRLRTLSWWIHGLSLLFAAALIGLFSWYTQRTRRWETELLRSEKLIGLGRLAATVAHDIKNPLGIIKATAQRLEKLESEGGVTDERRRELLRFIPEESDRLDSILSGYLRVGANEPTKVEAINVGESLQLWLKGIAGGDASVAGRFELSVIPTGPIMAGADAPRQVLSNLVNNALDASPEGSPVSIRWEPANGSFGQLSVADRGPGIPRSLRKRIFEPFFTTKAKGSGLGLYAIQLIVERDGGQVEVADNPGGGAWFIVRWPLAPDAENRSEETAR